MNKSKLVEKQDFSNVSIYQPWLKLLISIFSGILCLIFSKYSIPLKTSIIEISIPWSIIFPIIISFTYGKKYALISGLAGGALYPFYIWEMYGWANVLNFVTLMVLFLIIGITADLHEKLKGKSKLTHIRISLALGYSLFLYVCYVYFFNVLFKFNPPFWVKNTITEFPQKILQQFFLKDIINFTFLVIFSDALIRVKQIRKVLGLPVYTWMKNNTKIILVTIMVSIEIWFIIFLFNVLMFESRDVNNQHLLVDLIIIVYSSGILARFLVEFAESNLKSEESLILERNKVFQNEQKFRALYDKSPDMYVSVSPKTHEILLCNDTFLIKTGYTRKEIIGVPIFTVYHQDSLEEGKKAFEVFKQEGSINNKELIIRTKNGEKIYVSLNVTSIKDTNGNILYSMFSWRDISERIKLREEQLRDKQILDETGRLAKIGGWELDIETMTSYYTKVTRNIYGFTIDADIPKGIEGINYYPKEAQVKLGKLVQDAIEKGKPYDVELPFINKQGKHLWVRTIGIPEKKNGKVTRLYGTFQDITELKESERELIKAKEKAEVSDKLKSAFLSNMSHEIRTPMNGILGFTALLQDVNLSVENQKAYIDIIRKSGDRLLNTVNDIIEISKIESGQIDVKMSEVDLSSHLDTLVTFFRPEAKKKNIEIVVQNNIDGNDLSIQTDKNKLSSILSNLIKNAIKYTNEGTINVGLKIEEKQILFTCQDTGIGIPKNRQEAIFNRFEQADIEDKQVHEGSGLGLAIVKSYVEMLDGKIWLESEDGQGSTFYVSFPYNSVKKKKRNFSQEVKISDSDIKNVNVLIVEDDEISLMHLSAIMEGKVKNISTAQNGIEAVEACKNDSSIDLILMDIKMPKMDGIEATKKIRKFNKDVIIIAQTAYALEGDKEKALNAGCNDYISKPIKTDLLLELINKYF